MLKTKLFEIPVGKSSEMIIPTHQIEGFLEARIKRVIVEASLEDRSMSFPMALRTYKSGITKIYFSKANQKKLQAYMNDYIQIQIFEDKSTYGFEIPEELETVLSTDPIAKKLFENLTIGKRRSLVYSILKIKDSDLRIKKSLRFCKNIKLGVTDQKVWLKA